jgi:hypothetical protein
MSAQGRVRRFGSANTRHGQSCREACTDALARDMAPLPEHLPSGAGFPVAGDGSLTLNRIPVTNAACLACIVRQLTPAGFT